MLEDKLFRERVQVIGERPLDLLRGYDECPPAMDLRQAPLNDKLLDRLANLVPQGES